MLSYNLSMNPKPMSMFLHKLVREPYLVVTQYLTNFAIEFLDKHRFGVNTHRGSSREISTLYEDVSFDSPNPQLLTLTSLIYSNYLESISTYIKPHLTSFDETGFLWSQYMDRLAGEHYVLLPLIAKLTNAKNVVEIGTFQGASAKSLLLNTDCNITTFDLKHWSKFKNTFLSSHDFSGHRLTQYLADLSNESSFNKYASILADADLIFLDGPKNGYFESLFISRLINMLDCCSQKCLILVMDDTKLSTMSRLWRSIQHPKITLDIVGHWSGTGLVLLGNSSLLTK